MTGLARIQEIARQKQHEAAQRQAGQLSDPTAWAPPVVDAGTGVAWTREAISRADLELDRIDALPDSPERDAAFAKVNAWIENEWPKIDASVRQEALRGDVER